MNSWADLRGFTQPQKIIFNDASRFKVVVAGRRFGKTVLAVNDLIYEAQTGSDLLVEYIAPTYKMAKQLVWRALKEAIPRSMVKAKHETELSIELKGYNSIIRLRGAEDPDSLRGARRDHVIFDEFADIKEETWYEAIYPSLADSNGSALFVGTPKGFNWAYDLAMKAQELPGWSYHTYTTEQGGNVPEAEIEYARSIMSKRQFSQEFLASFTALANRIYSTFERAHNVRSDIVDLGGEIYVGMDFNVNPMSAVIASKAANQLHIFDEIEIENGNTEEMCTELKNRYPNRRITICPDPSGKARKTSAPVGQTDYSIIKSAGFQLKAPNAAPAVVDRVNEVNALCENAKGERRLFISNRCTKLIKCLEGHTYKKNTSLPDKSQGLDHLPDALGYLVHITFPIIGVGLSRLKLQGL